MPPKSKVVVSLRVTCPLCGKNDLSLLRGKADTRIMHSHSGLKEWRWTPYCGGSAQTIEGATAIQVIIVKLLREAVVLRKVENGFRITRAVKSGSLVGMTRERLDEKEEEFHHKADGVDHSISIMRGLPETGTLDDSEVDEKRGGRGVGDDLGRPTKKRLHKRGAD